MKNKFILLLILSLQFSLYGQRNLLSTAGNFYSNEDIQLSWSLGEPTIQTFSTNSLILTQGFQQTSLGITSTLFPELLVNITISPNPTKDYINIDFGQNNNLPIAYCIYNINGRLVKRGFVKNDNKKIDVSELSNEIYFMSFKHANYKLTQNKKFYKIN